MNAWTDPAPDSRFAAVDALHVRYKRAGRGPVVLLLHGSVSSLHGFEHVAELLSASFDVVRPDLPGFGLPARARTGTIGSRPTSRRSPVSWRSWRSPPSPGATHRKARLMTADTMIDVLVAGAGPTGTALAIDLARRGLDVRVIDRSPHAFNGSRAKGIQPRTLEVLHDLGALKAILDDGGGYPLLGVHLGPLTIPWRMMSSKQPRPDIPYPSTWLIPQHRTDRALHARLEQLGGAVEFGRELVGLTQDEDAVTAKVQGPDGVEEITAQYIVGADGGSSAVRKQLGIEFPGSTHEQDRIVIADAVLLDTYEAERRPVAAGVLGLSTKKYSGLS